MLATPHQPFYEIQPNTQRLKTQDRIASNLQATQSVLREIRLSLARLALIWGVPEQAGAASTPNINNPL
jgi:hypothetical protein